MYTCKNFKENVNAEDFGAIYYHDYKGFLFECSFCPSDRYLFYVLTFINDKIFSQRPENV